VEPLLIITTAPLYGVVGRRCVTALSAFPYWPHSALRTESFERRATTPIEDWLPKCQVLTAEILACARSCPDLERTASYYVLGLSLDRLSSNELSMNRNWLQTCLACVAKESGSPAPCGERIERGPPRRTAIRRFAR